MSLYQDIVVATEGGVALLAVNRPHKLNAYRSRTVDELRDAILQAEQDESVRSILLTGEGRAFGAGYDLSTVATDEAPALDAVLDDHFNPLVSLMRRTRLPIVAAVNGPCAGAAVGIAMAADLVVAARSAYFYEPFVGLGLVPDAGNTLFLPRILGRVRAAGMMMLGDRIPAQMALEWGLVWEVVDDDDLLAAAGRICARLGTVDAGALAATKRLLRHAADFGDDQQLALESVLQGEAARAPAMRVHIEAFLAKGRTRS